MARKKAADLFDEPAISESRAPDPPVSKGLGYLMTTEGRRLEIVTRTNRPIIGAIDAGISYYTRYKCEFIIGTIERLERLAVSSGGKGRQEIIGIVQAGGAMPAEFFGGQSSQPYDYPVQEDE
jgi:hypothetical protein